LLEQAMAMQASVIEDGTPSGAPSPSSAPSAAPH